MEWAHPGKGVGGRDGLDAWDPANWLLDGKPATEVRFDENTDIVLPDSDTPSASSFEFPCEDPIVRTGGGSLLVVCAKQSGPDH